MAESVKVYSYTGTSSDADGAAIKGYVVLQSVDGSRRRDHCRLSACGPHGSHRSYRRRGKRTLTETRITTTIPAATAYEHIHFGVWAGLGAAAADGSQEIAGLGIGFVQDIAGEGPTADMPNSGSATYNGNWVATVREADLEGDGDVTLVNGAATLDGGLRGRRDHGDPDRPGFAVRHDCRQRVLRNQGNRGWYTNTHNLTAGATFTGSFSRRVRRSQGCGSRRCLRLHVERAEGR